MDIVVELGQVVEFEVAESPRGLQAENVTSLQSKVGCLADAKAATRKFIRVE